MTLLDAIQTGDYTAAHKVFAQTMAEKLSLRLAQERTRVFESVLSEGSQVWWHGTVADLEKKKWKVKWRSGTPAGSTKVRVVSRDDGDGKDQPHYLETDDDNPRELGTITEALDYGIEPVPITQADVQRVFNEIGDENETALLCGVTHLCIDNGTVTHFSPKNLS
jgi:hypothetical protein